MTQDYHCPHCRADFTSHQELTDHINGVHHERKYRCTTCDEAFMAGMAWLDDE
jgi:DNA-directed RNA polymerase subunit RPC12/RpoP